MEDREERPPRFKIRRWSDIPNLTTYQCADDGYDRMITKFSRLFSIYEEQHERAMAESQTIRRAVLHPLRDYFLTAKMTCDKILGALLGARIEKGEKFRTARKLKDREAFLIIDNQFRDEINVIYEMGKQILYAAFVAIESQIWQAGFGDANEQWVGFVNDDA